MSELVKAAIVNWPHFAQGLFHAQKTKTRFMRTELKRGAQRIKKTFIKEQLQGPPGIKAGALAKGKNIWTFVTGESDKNLSAKIGISRILHVHEKGLTITPKSGQLLFIHAKGSGPVKDREIVGAVPKVVIPARLKFRALVIGEAPKMLAKVASEGARGIQVELTKALKKTAGHI
jgi:hypothetical protein